MVIKTKKELLEHLESGEPYVWDLPEDPEEYIEALIKKEAQEAKWVAEFNKKAKNDDPAEA